MTVCWLLRHILKILGQTTNALATVCTVEEAFAVLTIPMLNPA